MVPERDVDPAGLYELERVAFVDLLRSRPQTDLDRPVPATPAWAVHDVLAHVVAITADLNAQRFGGDPDDWTRVQVESRRGRSVGELADEWDREAPTFEDGLRLFGYGFGAHYLGDLLQHVGDVHAALGLPPARDDEAVAVALDFYLESFEESLEEAGVGAVEVVAAPDRWRLGPGSVLATVTGGRWDLFRSLGGRRTLDEVRALAWSGERDAVVGLVSRYPMPAAPLHEPRH